MFNRLTRSAHVLSFDTSPFHRGRLTAWRVPIILTMLIGASGTGASLAAQEATPTAASVVLAPDAEVAGFGLGEWSARYWQWILSLPPAINPSLDQTGERCGYGQSGPVFFLTDAPADVERTCSVPEGVHLFVPLLGSECSTVEPPPFYGADEADLLRCATGNVDRAITQIDMSALKLTVDGQDAGDLTVYRAVTPLFPLWLASDNPLGTPGGIADATASGYQVIIGPLSPGDHVVTSVLPGERRGQTVTITYHLTVVSGVTAPSSSAPTQEASPAASTTAGMVEWMVNVDGRALHIACAGESTGTPPVLFEQGGPSSEGGASLVTFLGADLSAALGTRFCAYDRAGTGASDPDPMAVRTFQETAADLNAVLASPDLGCPCVVVGESLGGGIALVALSEDSAGFGGLVLLDATYPGFFAEFLALAPAGSPELAQETDPYSIGENEEHLNTVTGFRQVAVPAVPPAIPVIVVTHGAGAPPPCNWDPPCSAGFPVADYETTWQAGQAKLAESLGGRLVVAEGASHTIANDNPGLVVSLVSEVIAAVLDPSTWVTPVASPTA